MRAPVIESVSTQNLLFKRMARTLSVRRPEGHSRRLFCSSVALILTSCFFIFAPPSLAAPPAMKAVSPKPDKNSSSGTKAQLASLKKETGKTPLSVAQRWAVACPAILDTLNQHGHSELCGEPRTPEAIESERRSLENWWGVKSQADLFGSFDWIDKEGGHRIFFEEIEKAINAPNSAEELARLQKKFSGRWSPSEFEDKVKVVRQYSPNLKGKGIYGWDYIRYIGLCRWGALAGYLSDDEAWQKIMPAARKLQKHFGSWSELGRNYLIGRRFWSRAQTVEDGLQLNRIYEWLLKEPTSPWVTVPWNTDLRPGPNTGGH